MKHLLIIFIFLFVYFNMFSQNFPPPEEVDGKDDWAMIKWQPPSLRTYIDTLNNYNSGDFLAEISPNWTTWSNLPGSNEDALITDELYYWHTAKIENETNIITDIDSTYTSGRFSFHITMLILQDHSAYFNLQKTDIPGEELGFEIFFGADTTATINAGGEAVLQFPFWSNQYLKFNMIVDLDQDWAEFYFDTYLLIDYQWSLTTNGEPGLNSLGGINISTEVLPGSNDVSKFYVRDARLRRQYTSNEGLAGYNLYLDGCFIEFIDSPDSTRYYYGDLMAGHTYQTGVSSVFQAPIGESIIVNYEFSYDPTGVFPFAPENVTATVNNYNEVSLTWDQPFWVLTYNLLGYHIYRNYQLIRVFGPNTTSFLDVDLPEGDYNYFMQGIYIHFPDFWWDSNFAPCSITFPIPQNISATSYESDILLEWDIDQPDQRNLIGFNVYRDNELIAEAINGLSYLDTDLSSGIYTYNVSTVLSGNFESELSQDLIFEHIITDAENQVEQSFKLSNFPNPFNPTTEIRFSVTQSSVFATLEIYNLKGQKVKTFSNLQISQSPNHQIVWNGTDDKNQPVSSGIYLYRLKAGNIDISRKCLLLK